MADGLQGVYSEQKYKMDKVKDLVTKAEASVRMGNETLKEL